MHLLKVNTNGGCMINRKLEIFIQVVEQGSFTRAATELYVTPASVMKQINQLEDQLNIKLLIRNHQGVELTSSGQSFYEDSLEIVEKTNKAIQKAQELDKKEIPIVRIGTSLLNPCQPLINLWNNQLNHLTNKLQIQIVPFDDTSQHILSFLSSLGKDVDIIFGACDSLEWKKRANFLQLGRYAHCIAVPRNHPLATKKKLSISDLDGQTMLVGEETDVPTLISIRAFLEKNNVKIIDIDPSYDADVFNRCELLNCLLLTLEPWKEVHPSLITLPVDWEFTIPYGILYSKTPSSAVRQFLTNFTSYK